jgi:hypothetical protein
MPHRNELLSYTFVTSLAPRPHLSHPHHTWIGGYYDNSKVTTTSPAAIDEKLSEWLWLESERLTGVKFNI